MIRKAGICVSVLLAGYGLACGAKEGQVPPGAAPTVPIAGPAGAGAVAPAQTPSASPMAASAARPVAPATPPAAPGPMASGPAAMPPFQAGGEPAAPPSADGTPETGANGSRYPDACSERRGSWGKPCTSNPDPCNLKSGYPGDEYCLLPPPEGKGVQIHFGPKSYTDTAEVAK